MQSNCLGCHCQGGKLSGHNYVKAIYLGSIIRGQFSGWQLFGGNYRYSIILWGNSLSTNCRRANYPGAITEEAIFLGGNYPEGNYPGSNCPGGNYSGRQLSWKSIVRAIIWGAIVLFPTKQWV